MVHLLVQVRKAVDAGPQKPTPPWNGIALYCDWALHVKLDRNRFIEEFFASFDFRQGMEIAEFFASKYFEDFVTLNKFRKLLKAFLGYHNLPTAIVDGSENWLAFVYLYAGVIDGATVKFSPSKASSSVTLSELKLDRVDEGGIAYIRTQALLSDGTPRASMTRASRSNPRLWHSIRRFVGDSKTNSPTEPSTTPTGTE